jgi:hypothetical protein
MAKPRVICWPESIMPGARPGMTFGQSIQVA